MRLITFQAQSPKDPAERLGALQDGRVIDLNQADSRIPANMIGFLEMGERGLALARAAAASSTAGVPAKDVRLLAPVPRPGALRDSFSFEEHARQGAARRGETLAPEWYEQPVYYKGNHREIYGTGDTVPWPSYTRKLDFELEIACVVGKKGRDLSPEQASSHIAGYTILNDWSARDIQKNEMICRMGPAKAKDFAYSLGPWLVTPDELGGEPDGLSMSVWVNGEKWSESDSSGRYWSFALMLSHVSQGETIYPGDVLGSGTYFQGCGLDMNRWIKPGDKVELKVEKLGILDNIVGTPKEQKHLKYDRKGEASDR